MPEPDAAIAHPAAQQRAPLWLRLLLLGVVLWLGVRITQNVTEALTGMARDAPAAANPPPAASPPAALRHAAWPA
jgi:hypothetical protein